MIWKYVIAFIISESEKHLNNFFDMSAIKCFFFILLSFILVFHFFLLLNLMAVTGLAALVFYLSWFPWHFWDRVKIVRTWQRVLRRWGVKKPLAAPLVFFDWFGSSSQPDLGPKARGTVSRADDSKWCLTGWDGFSQLYYNIEHYDLCGQPDGNISLKRREGLDWQNDRWVKVDVKNFVV